MNSLFVVTELDKEDIRSKFVSVTEEGNCSSNFVVCSFLEKSLNDSCGICLLSFHYLFSHYRLILSKFGINVSTAVEKAQLHSIDCLELFEKFSLQNSADLIKNYVKEIADVVSDGLTSLFSRHQEVLLVVDDLSDLLNAGIKLKTIVQFVLFLKTLLGKFNFLTVIVNCHHNAEDEDHTTLKSLLMNLSDFRINVYPLTTGVSPEISGFVGYSKKDEKTVKLWSPETLFHFKVTDRTIKLFSPGAV